MATNVGGEIGDVTALRGRGGLFVKGKRYLTLIPNRWYLKRGEVPEISKGCKKLLTLIATTRSVPKVPLYQVLKDSRSELEEVTVQPSVLKTLSVEVCPL